MHQPPSHKEENHTHGELRPSQSTLWPLPSCLKKRAAQWIFRLKQEYLISTSGLFLTLTYDNLNLPISSNGLPTLNKDHHQQFIKNLRNNCTRKYLNANKLKYYGVGEYGSKTQRPHYHYIIFNLPKTLLHEDRIDPIWKKGISHCGTVSSKSMAYVTGYLQKNLKQENRNSSDDRLAEKSYMSKGLGKNYITEGKTNYYKKKLHPYLVHQDGQKLSMPRYYKNKFYTEEEQIKVNAKVADYFPEITDYKLDMEQKKDEIRKRDRKNKQTRDIL